MNGKITNVMSITICNFCCHLKCIHHFWKLRGSYFIPGKKKKTLELAGIPLLHSKNAY